MEVHDVFVNKPGDTKGWEHKIDTQRGGGVRTLLWPVLLASRGVLQ